MLTRGLADLVHAIGEADIGSLLEATDGYSGSDMAALCREAAMGPCRDPGFEAALLSGVLSHESARTAQGRGRGDESNGGRLSPSAPISGCAVGVTYSCWFFCVSF